MDKISALFQKDTMMQEMNDTLTRDKTMLDNRLNSSKAAVEIHQADLHVKKRLAVLRYIFSSPVYGELNFAFSCI